MGKNCLAKILKFSRNHKNILLTGLFLLLLVFLFRKEIADQIDRFWIQPVMSRMYDYAWLFAVIASVILSVYYYIAYRYERIVSKPRKWIIGIIVAIYLLCLTYNCLGGYNKWEFSFWSGLIIVVPILGEFFLNRKCNKIKEETDEKSSLIYEKPIKNEDEDSYNRRNYAKIVANKVSNNFHKDGSYVIGITGSWGSGKTSFINLIKNNIDPQGIKDSKVIEIGFDFKPWLSSSCNNIIIDFFSQLSKELSPYIPQVKNKLADYADAVSDLNENPIIRSGIKLIKLGLPKSATNQYDDISGILEKAKLKVLVFVDDTDRLSPEEIVEVLRLVRNTANFPYLQFVITYDRDYLIESMRYLKLHNPDKYLEKIFNLEITLPKYDKKLLKVALNNELALNLKIEERYLKTIENNLLNYKNDFPIEKILITRRDIIRFTNSLIMRISI